MKVNKQLYGEITMAIKCTSRILLLAFIGTMILSVTSCGTVEEADVIGSYMKTSEKPVMFYTSSTAVTLSGTEGKVTLQLKADGMALVGDANLPWELIDDKVYLYMMNASTSGKFKGNKILELGGKDIVWEKK